MARKGSIGGVLALALLLARPVLAQSDADKAAVRRAAQDYIEGFYEGDTTKFVRSIRPDVFKYGFWRPRDSVNYAGEAMPYAEFLTYANNFKKHNRQTPASAPRDVVLLDVLNQTAVAKVTAWWGTDYLLIGKYGDRWMVSSVMWQSPPKG